MEANLRGLFKRSGHNGAVAYEKEPGRPCFIIGSEGETILRLDAPRRVIVPVVEYDSDGAIQDRLGALLWASVGGCEVGTKAFPRVRAGGAVKKLRRFFRGLDLELTALVVGSKVRDAEIRVLKASGLPLYGPCVLGDEAVVLGTCEPECVGEVAEVSYTINGAPFWVAALSVLNPLGVMALRVM